MNPNRPALDYLAQKSGLIENALGPIEVDK
jgi:hypothetical protein